MTRNILQRLADYAGQFQRNDEEVYVQKIDNDHALEWMEKQIPLLDCPDKVLEEIYYFRWWVFRKHLKETPEGTLITEFLPQVNWAGAYNTINCACGFHIREGRWLRGSRDTVENYIRFWLKGSGSGHSYSCWLAWAVWEYAQVTGRKDFAAGLLEELVKDYEQWEQEHYSEKTGLFWSIDDRDAMEMSISGNGFRPTLNSYMYGNALAISKIAVWADREEIRRIYQEKADLLRERVQDLLWDRDFFKVIPAENKDAKVEAVRERGHDVKELIGYIPWYFDLPDSGKGYEEAFRFLMDENIFLGKYGLRTADASHPRYRYPVDHECLWNGPSWPFATTQTLVAAANLLDNREQDVLSAEDYFYLLKMYARCQYLKREDGSTVPWIDEDLDPENGTWIAREILKDLGWLPRNGGYERGKDYNHSMFCDLIISGLFGVKVRENGEIELHPKIPEEGAGRWDYCALDRVPIGEHLYRIQYDRTGGYYGNGSGWKILKQE